MAASKKKRTGARAAVVVVLCLVLVCVVAAAVALGLVSRRVKSFAGGASFSLDYQITSTAAEEPALYKVLAQFGGTSGRVDGQYTPEALQLELYPQASGSSQPLTRLYISKDETLYDAGQLYRTLRSSITDNYPLAGVLIPEWNMGSYISQTQLASLLGVDDTATSLQSMNDFQLDLKKIKKVQPENAKEGYLYFRLETDDTAADSPVLTLGVEKSGLLRAASPAVHILLDIPAHGIHTELTGTVTAASSSGRNDGASCMLLMTEEKAKELEQKIRKNRFTLQDFYDQIQATKKMGSMGDILGKLPGLSGKLDESQLDDNMFAKTEAIILSMTKKEREDASLINASRRRRIAMGSGTTVADVNALLKQFGMMQTLTKQMSRGKMPRGLKGLLGGGGGLDMNSLGDMGRGGFGMGAHSAGRQRKSNKRKKKKR